MIEAHRPVRNKCLVNLDLSEFEELPPWRGHERGDRLADALLVFRPGYKDVIPNPAFREAQYRHGGGYAKPLPECEKFFRIYGERHSAAVVVEDDGFLLLNVILPDFFDESVFATLF